MVEAARKYNKIVQVGTMNRSRPAVIQAIKFLQDGGIGKVYMARGLCFKRRAGIGKYPDGPMQPGEKYKLNVESTAYEPTYDAAYLAKVDYDLWLGPAPQRAFNRNRFHYNWHWHWDYGNGDTGNQGPHQFDIARWGLGKNEHPGPQIASTGGYFGRAVVAGDAGPAHLAFEYADGSILEFGTRGDRHQRRRLGQDRQPVLRVRRAGSGSTATAGSGSRITGRKTRRARARTRRPRRQAAATRTCSRASSRRTTRTSSTPSAPATRRS